MLQLAIVCQILAILFFVLNATAPRPREATAPPDPITGRLYDYYIPTNERTSAYFGQVEVLAVKDGYVKVRHQTFVPGTSYERVETLEEFRKYTTLAPLKRNPFEREATTNNSME